MKQVLFLAGLFASSVVFAQKVQEPDFIGEALVIKADNSVVQLEKTMSQTRTASNAAMVITGFGSVVSKLMIDGCCAKNRFKVNEPIKIIVKAVDNNTDPMAIIKIFAFDSYKKNRKAELSATNVFGRTKTNNLKYLPFTAKKYGTSSYIITLNEQPVGEYGITVSNPNQVDEKTTVVSSFAFEQ